MKGINSKKKLNTAKQLCAGHKISEPVMRFFEYSSNEDVRKIKFREIDKIEFNTESEVEIVGRVTTSD